MARFVDQSPKCKLWKLNDRWEAPFFKSEQGIAQLQYEPGLANGHKYSAYLFSLKALTAAFERNRDTLLVINIRPALPTLLSWMKMHRKIAERGTGVHMAVASDEAKQFYSTCTADEYFDAYADTRLNHAEAIARFRERFPEARVMVVSQGRLARDARGVMSKFHKALGLTAPRTYLNSLPKSHESSGERAMDATPVSDRVRTSLDARDAAMRALLDTLGGDQKLVLEGDRF
jgi:hypothetical protein